ncbi:hypothetical protein [Paraburkholderia oxyphila]|nr:hypothetical protein [Paraburkholderia oxyphila]
MIATGYQGKDACPEKCGACFRRREHGEARPDGMNVAERHPWLGLIIL